MTKKKSKKKDKKKQKKDDSEKIPVWAEFLVGFVVAAVLAWFLVSLFDEQVYNFLIKFI